MNNKITINLYKEDFSAAGWEIYCEQFGVPQNTNIINIEVNTFKAVK